MPRTAAQVDALWPNSQEYYITGFLAIFDAWNPIQAAKRLQPLYDNGVSGFFNVEKIFGESERLGVIFEVKFTRFVGEDSELPKLHEKLLNGDNFCMTVTDQLAEELAEAIGNDLTIKVLLLGHPYGKDERNGSS